MKRTFLCFAVRFSSGRRLFLALPAAGHVGGLRVHHGATVGSRRARLRVLWAFKVARASKQPRDRYPPSQSYSGPWKSRQSSHSLWCCCITTSLQRSSYLLGGSHGTTAVSRTSTSALCDGHGRCFSLCVHVCHDYCRPTVGTIL